MFRTCCKWTNEAMRRLDCPLINFSSVDTRRRLNFFSFSSFSLLAHFYRSTRMPLLANDFRQGKNLFRRQLMSVYLIARKHPLIYQIYDHGFQFSYHFCAISLYLKSEILCVIFISQNSRRKKNRKLFRKIN